MTALYKKSFSYIFIIIVLSGCGDQSKKPDQSSMVFDYSDVMLDISTYDYNKRVLNAKHDWNFYSSMKEYCNADYIKLNGGQSCTRETNNMIYTIERFKSALLLSKQQAVEINSYKKQAIKFLKESEMILKDRADLDNDNSKLKNFVILGAEILIAFGLIQVLILILMEIKKRYSKNLTTSNAKLKKIKTELTYEIKLLEEHATKFNSLINFDEVVEKQKAFDECNQIIENAKREKINLLESAKVELKKAQKIIDLANANTLEQFKNKEMALKNKEEQLDQLQQTLEDEAVKLKLMSEKIYG